LRLFWLKADVHHGFRRDPGEQLPMCCDDTERAPEMDSHWQDQLLSLVNQYGQQCAQLAAERERGKHGNPPADRAGAWAAILSHLSHAQRQSSAQGEQHGQAA
jgi:hypothetical protein